QGHGTEGRDLDVERETGRAVEALIEARFRKSFGTHLRLADHGAGARADPHALRPDARGAEIERATLEAERHDPTRAVRRRRNDERRRHDRRWREPARRRTEAHHR